MTLYRDRVRAAQRFAAANKSDPFALNRAMTYIRKHRFELNKAGEPCDYDAQEGTETRRLPDGTEYQAVVYTNQVRP